MMMDDDHHRPSSSSSSTATISPPPSSCGPINSNSGGNEVAVGCSWSSSTHIYHHDGSTPASAAAVAAASASVLRSRRRRRTFQSFDIFSTTASRSPGGGGMAAALGFPFTMAQWKELQRQAMIYKYMVASLPVPPYLLCSSDQDPAAAASHSSLGGGGCSVFNLSLKFSNSKDPEPGRCKRTDGKKWRCSRDVAPNQKYCERHMHRGRPRSRKPVELHSPFTTTNSNKKPRSALPPTPKPTSHSPISSSPRLLESTMQPPNGGLDWTVEQEWQHLLQTNIGLTSESSAVFQQDCIQEPLNLMSYADFANPDLLGFHSQPQIETPRGFIDAWSNEDLNANNSNNESSVSSHSNNLSPSSLTLSMAMTLDEEMDNQQKPHVSSWVNPVSWLDSATPGGPLAEVLNHSSVTENSAPSFPFPCNEGSTRPSSPSDASGCTSPTVAASKIMPFQWLS
ncbi:growth-regulating factor 2 [Diospyros lotus]|uniref:growth-regulating factor 2 n=1 Tax=Diospyros lotus TaxID=55363 RepID=UPI002258DA08|nr:growth-regulating factor 2 [Diospyros lotus]